MKKQKMEDVLDTLAEYREFTSKKQEDELTEEELGLVAAAGTQLNYTNFLKKAKEKM